MLQVATLRWVPHPLDAVPQWIRHPARVAAQFVYQMQAALAQIWRQLRDVTAQILRALDGAALQSTQLRTRSETEMVVGPLTFSFASGVAYAKSGTAI